MLSKEGPDERTHGDDAQSFAPRRLKSGLDQSLAHAATSKSWWHLRVQEHQRVPSALVVEEGHFSTGHELEPVRRAVVGDRVVRDMSWSETNTRFDRIGCRIAREKRLLEGLIKFVGFLWLMMIFVLTNPGRHESVAIDRLVPFGRERDIRERRQCPLSPLNR
jgi:hypothetical protein